MKTKSLFFACICVLIVALCACSQTKNSSSQDNENSENKISMNVIDCIMTRTSVRSYSNRAVEKETMETLLRAGMAAPSAVDKRPWHFIVVDDKAMLDSISRVTPNAGMASNAPLAIIVCGDTLKALEGEAQDFWIEDASAAAENILLAAHGIGLGAVWTGLWPAKERCGDISRVFSLPENIIPLCTIVIGYPATEASPKDKWDINNISYNTYGEAFEI